MCIKTWYSLTRWTTGLAPALALAVATLQPDVAAAQGVVFELDTATFLGQGSGAARGPNTATFPPNTDINVDIAPGGSSNKHLLTFNNVQFPNVVDQANDRRWVFSIPPGNDFTLIYDAVTGGINDPIDATDSVQIKIDSFRISDNQPDGSFTGNIEFTTDETLQQGCIPGATQTAEAMRWDEVTEEVVLAAALCVPSGAALSPFWLKLGGMIPLPVPEPGAAAAALASIGTLAGLRRRRGDRS